MRRPLCRFARCPGARGHSHRGAERVRFGQFRRCRGARPKPKVPPKHWHSPPARGSLRRSCADGPSCIPCLDAALSLAQQAIDRDPNYAEGYVQLAIALGFRGRLMGAATAQANHMPERGHTAIDKALSLNPQEHLGQCIARRLAPRDRASRRPGARRDDLWRVSQRRLETLSRSRGARSRQPASPLSFRALDPGPRCR